MKTAAAINAEKIEAIILDALCETTSGTPYSRSWRVGLARKVVEACPELSPVQFTSERDGTSRVITHPLPWAKP